MILHPSTVLQAAHCHCNFWCRADCTVNCVTTALNLGLQKNCDFYEGICCLLVHELLIILFISAYYVESGSMLLVAQLVEALCYRLGDCGV